MKPFRALIAPFAILAICLGSLAYSLLAQSQEKIAPAYTAPQQQASALAVPSPNAARPASILVITVCNNIVGMIVADAEGVLHPLNFEGLSQTQLQSVIDRVPLKLAVNAGCAENPDRQPIF